MMGLLGSSNLWFIRAEEEEDKIDTFMICIIMTEEMTKIDIDQIVVTEEISIDRIEVGQDINKITGERILEVMWEHINILEDRIVENTGVIAGMKITLETEVGVGQGKGHF